jgi:putative intracellular protease/amidase
MPKNVLFIVTSHTELGSSGKKTGSWLSEVAHPYNLLKKHYNVIFASPLGGPAPIDPKSIDSKDVEVQAFLADNIAQQGFQNTKKLSEVINEEFDGLFYPGGHGPIFDLAKDPISQEICKKIWEQGKPVAALCHGPAAIANVKLSNGTYLVKGKKVTGFSNEEEAGVQLTEIVPFLLEDVLKANGGIYEKKGLWQPHVVVDGKLLTAQNPASATLLAEEFHKVLA